MTIICVIVLIAGLVLMFTVKKIVGLIIMLLGVIAFISLAVYYGGITELWGVDVTFLKGAGEWLRIGILNGLDAVINFFVSMGSKIWATMKDIVNVG